MFLSFNFENRAFILKDLYRMSTCYSCWQNKNGLILVANKLQYSQKCSRNDVNTLNAKR